MFKDRYSLSGETDVTDFSGYGYLFMNCLKSFGHSLELLWRVD
jgi:hypothetical protein